MGRPKNFTREEVLESAIPVFWKRGFADTSVQELERATGVNKSGLYSEFESKEDLFVAGLRHYLETRGGRELLTVQPLGWGNVERFLELGQGCRGQKGCFSVNSMRELAVLPAEAQEVITDSVAQLKRLLVKNIQAEQPKMDPGVIADLVLTFFSGICIEQNLKGSRPSLARKIDSFMGVLRTL